MDLRRAHHIKQGDATRQQNGRIFCRHNPLSTLRERQVARIGAEMADSEALPFRPAADGETVGGTFAVVEKSHEFTLVS